VASLRVTSMQAILFTIAEEDAEILPFDLQTDVT
jgi:hypothetical protein